MNPASELEQPDRCATVCEPDEALTFRKVLWRIMPLLVICYAVSYLDRVNISFAKLQMASDLGLSDTVYGLGAGIFFVGYVIAEVPSNLILHRVGARRWIARILVTWGLLSAAMALTTTPTSFYILRFLLGVAEAGFFPGAVYYLMQWIPADHRGRAMSIFYLGAAISGLIGGPLSGLILQQFAGVSGLAGWQWMFILEACPAIVLGFFVWRYLEEDYREVSWLSPAEKALIANRMSTETNNRELVPFSKVFRSAKVWLFGGCLFLLVMGQYGIYFWLPTMIKESGVTNPLHIGLLTAIPYAFSIMSMLYVGRRADKAKDSRHYLLGTCIVGSAALLGIVHGVLNTGLMIVLLSIATACSYIMLALFYTFPPGIFRGKSAAAGLALVNSTGVTAGFVAPYMIGFLRDLTQSPASGMYLLAACWLIGGCLSLRFPKRP